MRVPLRNVLGLDLRSLGAFRICLASVLLLDLCNRLRVMRDLFTDWGVLPRSAVIEYLGNPLIWSLHFMSGRYEVMLLLAVLAFVFGVMLLIGYQTRLATICSWVLFASINSRNLAASQGSDDLLRLTLFWSMFVPLGACFSVDARRSRFRPDDYLLLTTGSLSLVLQLLMMYWWAGALKTHPRWFSEGTAIYYALSMDQFVKPFGEIVRALPISVLIFLSRATICLELAGPFLFFVTWRRGVLRFLTALAFIGFHVGLDATMELGLFSYICITGWIATFPSTLWTAWLPALARRLTVPTSMKSIGDAMAARFCAWTESLPCPEAPRLQLSRFTRGPCALLFALAAYWNFATWRNDDRWVLVTPLREIGYAFRIDQGWGLFAPAPSIVDGWIVVDAKLADGSSYDIWNDRDVRFTRPARMAPLFRDVLWRIYLINLAQANFSDHRLYFGRYLCRQWNDAHTNKTRVETLKIFFMRESTPPPGQPIPVAEKVQLWRHFCFQKPANWDTLPDK